jgi:hypothetical protein
MDPDGWVLHKGYITAGKWEEGIFVPMPDIYEVPHYTSKTDD